jgi:hypothetical protein
VKVRWVPVTGLTWISAACSPRPASTCRSSALKHVFSRASGNQRYSGAALSSRATVGDEVHVIASAAGSQKPSGSAMLRACAWA